MDLRWRFLKTPRIFIFLAKPDNLITRPNGLVILKNYYENRKINIHIHVFIMDFC